MSVLGFAHFFPLLVENTSSVDTVSKLGGFFFLEVHILIFLKIKNSNF